MVNDQNLTGAAYQPDVVRAAPARAPTRTEVGERIVAYEADRGRNAFWVGQGSPRRDFDHALERGLVTDAEYELARQSYVSRHEWNVAGD